MRISDWSSDVCSSDLLEREPPPDRDHPLNLFGEDGADILRQRFIGSKKQFICKFSGIALEIALLGAPAVADAILVVVETTVVDLLRKRSRCDRDHFANEDMGFIKIRSSIRLDQHIQPDAQQHDQIVVGADASEPKLKRVNLRPLR